MPLREFLVLRDNAIEDLRELHKVGRRNLCCLLNVKKKMMKVKKHIRKNRCRMDKISMNFKQVQENFCFFSAE
jgi:hypothetical protein